MEQGANQVFSAPCSLFLDPFTMPLSLIAAVSRNNCIGKNGKLPWHLPEDLKHFKELTTGKIVLMGRKTWESLPEQFRPLPKRKNIVITRQEHFLVPETVEVYSDIDTVLKKYSDQEIMVIGGAEIYAKTLPLADTLYITQVHQEVQGNAFFPEIDLKLWNEVERRDEFGLSFVTYKKIST